LACKPAPTLLTLSSTAVIAFAPAFGDTSADPTKVALTSFRRSLVAVTMGFRFGSERFMALSITD
jgi:hypothetical protein